jgi:signal transduction histidine kinase
MQDDPDVLAVGAPQLMPDIHANALAPIRVEGEFLGFLSMSKAEIGYFSEPDAEALQSFADQAAIAIRNARLYEAAAHQQEELQRLSRRVVEALEEERWRLARELHDQIGQNLNALGLELNLLRTEVGDSDPAEVGQRLEDAITQLKQTSGHLRSVMTDLRPAVLDDYGLDAALSSWGRDFADRFGLELDIRSSVAGGRPDRAVETALFRVAQEALTNVARHAHAAKVTISLAADAETLRLEIADDGAGFDPEATPVDQPERPPWGLLIMRERLQAVAGTLRVESVPGTGTRIVAEVARSQ